MLTASKERALLHSREKHLLHAEDVALYTCKPSLTYSKTFFKQILTITGCIFAWNFCF